jgi:hypothetical protein
MKTNKKQMKQKHFAVAFIIAMLHCGKFIFGIKNITRMDGKNAGGPIMMMTIPAKKENQQLTQKEKATITFDTKAARAALLLLDPPPYMKITPAPGIGNYNPLDLYNYVSPRLIKIIAITEFADANPTAHSLQDIAAALYPYAIQNGHKMLSADLETRNTLAESLRTQFGRIASSCALLANGNLALFLLTDIKAKGKAVKHNKRLDATNFKLSSTKGGGNMGVSCDVIEFANDYTVFWGKGEYDKATWNSQNGSSRQTVTGLNPGEEYNFIMVANSKVSGPGFWPNAQSRKVPFN